MATASRFVDDVVAVLDEGVPVHVELRALTFIDSVGITALAKIAQYGGERVSFGRATPDVQRSLDAVAAERYLRFAGDPAGRRT